jgi:outer membrane protein TolC
MIAPRVIGAALLALLPPPGLPSLAAQTADSLPVVSLAQARRLAAAVDPELVASRADVATAGWERRSARADLLTPNLFAGLSYIRFSEPFFNFGTGDISPNATSATLEARYVALGAGKLSEVRRAGASAASALANETASSFRSALVTDAAYYAVLAELELSRVAAARLSRALEQLGVARVRVQAGETIATDSLQLVLEVNRARLDVLRRDSALIVSRLRLGRQIGLPGPADARAVDSLPPPPLPMTFDEAVADLRTRGPELLAARAEERRAAASLGAQREGYLPDVTLSATTGAYDSEFFPSATKRSQFAVTVSVPIWDGARRELSVARARAERDVARAVRDDLDRAAALGMAEVFNGYRTARAGIELAMVGVAVSTETYRVQGARYREGETTILDLLEAQVALSQSEAELVQARYGARLALSQIEARLGRRLFQDPS